MTCFHTRFFRGPFLAAVLVTLFYRSVSAASPLDWSYLRPLPDEHGLAGSFTGVSGGALIVAGGANFPDGYPWDGGTKIWHDRIFVLESPEGTWETLSQRLPKPAAYGVSISLPLRDSIIFIGGSGPEGGFHSDVSEVKWDGNRLMSMPLPSLPMALATACGAALGDTLYLAGGTSDDQTAVKSFLRLDLSAKVPRWESLPWPIGAPGRILAVAGVLDGKFHLFSGADLGADTWDKRTYLRDAWSFDPATGKWSRLADLPHETVAAPSPAIPVGPNHLLVLGGSNRAFVETQRSLRPATDGNGLDHPGFPRDLLAYHSITNTWETVGEVPAPAPVTATTVLWKGKWITPSGEIKPGIRTPLVPMASITPTRKAFGALNWFVVAAYLGGMLLIGYWFSRRETTTDDYFRGGQRIPWWAAGLSIFATMLSAITFMSIPARAYATDVSWYVGQLPILLVVPLVVFFYLPFFRRLNITSAYEYLEKRFNLATRLFASLSFMLLHVGRIAVVLYLPALALAQVSSVNVITCIVIIGLLCVIYTVMGGIEAVVWTDAVQAIVLLGGAALCFFLVCFRVEGGLAGIWHTATTDGKLFQNLTYDLDVRNGTTSTAVIFTAFLFNALISYTSSQDVVQRYVTTPSEKAAARSLWTTMILSVFGSMIFFGLGTALYAFYKAHPASLDPAMTSNDGILPFFILQQIPPGLAGLLIAAIFAAAQSTVSSSLNSVATTYTTDFHARVLRPRGTDRQRLLVARFVVVLIGALAILVACFMAKSQIESAFKTFNQLIGLTAGSLGGLFALGIFNRRANGIAALIGAAAGVSSVLYLSLSHSTISGLLYGFVSFTTCLVAGTAAGFALPARSGSVKELTLGRERNHSS